MADSAPIGRKGWWAATVSIAACAASWASLAAHDRITTTVTWDREVSAIVTARCVTCHTERGRTPMSLETYESSRPWARAIRHEVLTRRMPIWHAARGYGDFANDPSLSPFEIALIVAWVDGGAPKSLPDRKGQPSIGPALAPAPAAPASGDRPQYSNAREIAEPCGDRTAPDGRLVGLRPELEPGASVHVTARLPDGRQEVLGWFRDYDPAFAPTYWLRRPLDLPTGARLVSEADGGRCRIVFLTVGSSASRQP